MFEKMTFEVIMKEMLGRVSETMDKREGSVIWDALAPAAVELAAMYVALDGIIFETFADTASLFYLKRRCAERGIYQEEATKAVLKAEFSPTTLDIPMGSRFSCGILNYAVIEKIGDGVYRLECETPGTQGNAVFGQLIPIDYIQGLQTGHLTELLIPAEDDEDVEKLRARYFESIRSQAFGGNITDYKQKVNKIAGVGGCKVIPVWNGGGTVKLIIVDATFGVPSQDLISLVKETMDPTEFTGQGYGLAPIGHVVTVVGADATNINITADITYEPGWNWASAKNVIQAAIDDYFASLAEEWATSDNLIVRVSRIEAAILSCECVLDVEDIKINGSSRNITLAPNQICKRGTVNGE